MAGNLALANRLFFASFLVDETLVLKTVDGFLVERIGVFVFNSYDILVFFIGEIID